MIFGLTAPEAAARMGDPNHGHAAIAGSSRLAETLYAMRGGTYSPGDRDRYAGLVDGLAHHDRFLVTDDFASYWDAQRRVDGLWSDPAAWWRMSALNTARIGWFSSDRTIREYAGEIWRAPTL